ASCVSLNESVEASSISGWRRCARTVVVVDTVRPRSKELPMTTQPTMPKADPGTAAFFRTIIPNDPRVSIRPTFGHSREPRQADAHKEREMKAVAVLAASRHDAYGPMD